LKFEVITGFINLIFECYTMLSRPIEALKTNGFFTMSVPEGVVKAQITLAQLVRNHYHNQVSNEKYVYENDYVCGFKVRKEGAKVHITPYVRDKVYSPWQETEEFNVIFDYYKSLLKNLADEIGVPSSRQYYMAINFYATGSGKLNAHTDYGYLTMLITDRGVHYVDIKDKVWKELTPNIGEVICQAGGALQVINNDYSAMPHAVCAGEEKVSFVILCDPEGEMELRSGDKMLKVDANHYISTRFIGANEHHNLNLEQKQMFDEYLKPLVDFPPIEHF